MANTTGNMRRYEGVPIGTLLHCLRVWQDELYSIEYRTKQNASMGAGKVGEIWEAALDMALDIQDILSEIVARRKPIYYDTVKDEYSEFPSRTGRSYDKLR